MGNILTPYLKRYENGIVVFDHTMSEFAVTVAKTAQSKGFKALALPHAVVHREDAPDNPGDETAEPTATQTPHRPPGSHGYNLYDAVVVPNQFVAERMIKRGMLSEKIHILGSMRFCEDWVRQLRRILPPFSTGRTGKRVIFLLSKQTPLVDWPAVEQTIDQ